MTSLLERREDAFRDRDAFLYALLGVISLGKRLERALERLEAAPILAARVDQQVDLVLGLISLSRKSLTELQAWRDSVAPGQPSAAAAPPTARMELMR